MSLLSPYPAYGGYHKPKRLGKEPTGTSYRLKSQKSSQSEGVWQAKYSLGCALGINTWEKADTAEGRAEGEVELGHRPKDSLKQLHGWF